MTQHPARSRSAACRPSWLTLLLGLGLGYGIYLYQLGWRLPVVLVGLLPTAAAVAIWSDQDRKRRSRPVAALNLLDPVVFGEQLRQISRGSPLTGTDRMRWHGALDKLEAIQSLALQCAELDDSCELESRVLLTQLLELAETCALDLRQLGSSVSPSARALRQRRLQALDERLDPCLRQLQLNQRALLDEALAQAGQADRSLATPERFPSP
jgi:hypothetical protein